MKRPPVAATAVRRPSRILILLAAAWLIAAMAIGGLSLDVTAQSAPPTTVVAEP